MLKLVGLIVIFIFHYNKGIQPEVDMSFDEVDKLFYLLENPTRRRILQLLSVEKLYPLVSKEIDVTQQAVVKHLRSRRSWLSKIRDEPSEEDQIEEFTKHRGTFLYTLTLALQLTNRKQKQILTFQTYQISIEES